MAEAFLLGIRRGKIATVLAAMSLLTAACANENSIFRNSPLGGQRPRVITEDAKQRNTYIVPEYVWDTDKKNQFITNWRICAEAAPDVFSALSTSAGADVGFAQTGTDTEAAAKLAIAIAESAGTIERTQTINLLRESMYRTCERYLSHALGKEAFVVQAGRDWRAMIAILAIEQLTRTARPTPTILVPPSTSAVITSPAELATELRRAAVATEDARIRKERADQAVTDASCPAAAPAADADQAARDKWAQCVALKEAAANAADDLRRAEAAQTALSDAVAKSGGSGGGSVSARTGSENASIAGGSEQVRSATDLQAVADNVERIVMAAFKTDETQLFCLQTLNTDVATPADPQTLAFRRQLQAKCLDYAISRIDFEARKLGLTANVEMDVEKLMRYLGSRDGEAVRRWRGLLSVSNALEMTLPPTRERLLAAQTIADIRQAFLAAEPSLQAQIAQQIDDLTWE